VSGPAEGGRGPTPHRIVNPPDLSAPAGFAHALVAAPGRLAFLGGQTAHAADGSLPGPGIVEQFDAAAANVVIALDAAGGRPEHIAWMQVFTSDADAYLGSLQEIGVAYRRHFGAHYPAMAWFEVKSLFDAAAIVEIMAIAVVPEP
jgi:enamine deaminase RidA (YjgF/YER057c/UK114 family)